MTVGRSASTRCRREGMVVEFGVRLGDMASIAGSDSVAECEAVNLVNIFFLLRVGPVERIVSPDFISTAVLTGGTASELPPEFELGLLLALQARPERLNLPLSVSQAGTKRVGLGGEPGALDRGSRRRVALAGTEQIVFADRARREALARAATGRRAEEEVTFAAGTVAVFVVAVAGQSPAVAGSSRRGRAARSASDCTTPRGKLALEALEGSLQVALVTLQAGVRLAHVGHVGLVLVLELVEVLGEALRFETLRVELVASRGEVTRMAGAVLLSFLQGRLRSRKTRAQVLGRELELPVDLLVFLCTLTSESRLASSSQVRCLAVSERGLGHVPNSSSTALLACRAFSTSASFSSRSFSRDLSLSSRSCRRACKRLTSTRSDCPISVASSMSFVRC